MAATRPPETGESVPRPADFSEPGYYQYSEKPRRWRWHNGTDWEGPSATGFEKSFLSALTELGVSRSTARILMLMFGLFGAAIILVFLLYFLVGVGRGGGDDEPDASTVTTAAPVVATAPATTPAAATIPAATVAPAAGATTLPPPSSTSTTEPLVIDTSGVWSFTWSWGVTEVSFEGEVSGSGASWTFQGDYAGGGSSTWRPESGAATCSLSGEPLADLSTPGTMTCSVTVPEDGWAGETSGQITLLRNDVVRFEYKGGGTGTSSTATDAPIVVHLRPAG